MFLTRLILCQSSLILMVAHQRNLESLAAFDGVGDTGASDEKSSGFDTRELLQFFQLCHKGPSMLLADIGAKFEQD